MLLLLRWHLPCQRCPFSTSLGHGWEAASPTHGLTYRHPLTELSRLIRRREPLKKGSAKGISPHSHSWKHISGKATLVRLCSLCPNMGSTDHDAKSPPKHRAFSAVSRLGPACEREGKGWKAARSPSGQLVLRRSRYLMIRGFVKC